MLGVIAVSQAYIGGQSRHEVRQYAVRGWQTVDATVASLEVCFAAALPDPIVLDGSRDFRYRNVIAELNASCFFRIRNDFGCYLDGLSAADVPVL